MSVVSFESIFLELVAQHSFTKAQQSGRLGLVEVGLRRIDIFFDLLDLLSNGKSFPDEASDSMIGAHFRCEDDRLQLFHIG